MSNALKYAFPQENHGTIRVRLQQCGTDSYCLTVEDNGVGLPAWMDFLATNTLGLQLVRVLAEQLHATFELETGAGTLFRITFTPHAEERMADHG